MSQLLGVINGAGRLKYHEYTAPKYEPHKVVDGLYSLPLDSDIRDYNDGDLLFKAEFVRAARQLGLHGMYGSPTFGAIAKHMLESDRELFRAHQYHFAGDTRPSVHFALDTEKAAEVVELAERTKLVKGMTPKRLMVARSVLDIATDEELARFRREVGGLTAKEIRGVTEEYENDGYEVTRRSFEPLEILRSSSHEESRILVVLAGSVLLRQNREDYIEYRAGKTVYIDGGAVVDGFVTDEGCEFLEAISPLVESKTA